MSQRFFKTALVVGLALTSSLVVAQEQPGPKLPAMPSMDQKGSDDLSKPAGAIKSPPPAAAPKPSSGEGAKAKPANARAAVDKGAPAKTQGSRRPAVNRGSAKRGSAKTAGARKAPHGSSRPGVKPRSAGRAPRGRPIRTRR